MKRSAIAFMLLMATLGGCLTNDPEYDYRDREPRPYRNATSSAAQERWKFYDQRTNPTSSRMVALSDPRYQPRYDAKYVRRDAAEGTDTRMQQSTEAEDTVNAVYTPRATEKTPITPSAATGRPAAVAQLPPAFDGKPAHDKDRSYVPAGTVPANLRIVSSSERRKAKSDGQETKIPAGPTLTPPCANEPGHPASKETKQAAYLPPAEKASELGGPVCQTTTASKSELKESVSPVDSAEGLKAVSNSSSQQPVIPTARLLNSRRITINYEVKDTGPSGVSNVDLYYTRDGQEWHKSEGHSQAGKPATVEVEDDGLYGFTLVARSGAGMSKEPPKTGDQPQIWVEVKTTKPSVRFVSAEPVKSGKRPSVCIRWSASDKHLTARPITLSFAEQADGPWIPFATNLENSGSYTWETSSAVPHRFFVRIEAIDAAGNIGTAQSSSPVLVDLSKPSVSVLNIEAGK